MPNPLQALNTIVSGLAQGAQGFLSRTVDDPLFPVKSAYWFIFGQGRDPFLPEEGVSIEERARAAKTPQEAQAVIDDVLGGLSRRDYLLLDVFRNRGFVEKYFSGRLNNAFPAFQPFSNANAYIAVNAASRLGRTVDPYTPLDQWFDDIFRKNERNMLLYLRETDPLSVMPYLYETDIRKATGGGHWWSPLTDWAGRIMSSSWKHISGLFLMPERLEEVLGQVVWNQLPDPYMRYALSRNLYELNYSFLEDFIRGNEPFARGRELMDKLSEIQARGLKGEELIQEYERAIKDATTVGGWIGNLFNLIVVDPLWILPVGKLFEGGSSLFERALGFRPSRLLRLFGAGGETFGYGLKGLFQMDEATYQYQRLIHPHAGVVRTLFAHQPDRLADEAIRQLLFRLQPYSDDLFRLDPDSLRRLQDLQETFSKGEPVGWVKEAIPDILDEPSLAFLSAAVRGRKWLESAIGDDAINNLITKLESWSEIGQKAIPQELEEAAKSLGMSVDEFIEYAKVQAPARLLLESVMSKARAVVMEAQRDYFKRSLLGRVFLRASGPERGLKVWVARFSFGPPFVTLNLNGNYFRFIWHAARHPLDATKTFIRSLMTEAGGKWPEEWERMVRNVLIQGNPVDIELSVVRNTGFHELLGTKKAAEFLSDIEDPAEFLTAVVKQLQRPARDILNANRSKILGIPTNWLFWPLHVASGIDRATRRAVFISSLKEQFHELLVPGWIARRVLPNVEDRLAATGITPDQSRQIMGRFIDKLRRGLFDGEGFVEGDTAASFINRAMEETLEEAGLGSAAVVFNPTKLLYEWAKARGYQGDVAAIATNNALGHDVVGRIERILSEVTPQDDLNTILTKIDAIADDYYNLNAVGSELARQPVYTQRDNVWAHALGIQDMKKAWMDTVSYPYRLFETTAGKDAMYRIPRKMRLPDGSEVVDKPARVIHNEIRAATVDQYNLLRETEEQAAKLKKEGVDKIIPGYAGDQALDEKSFSQEVYDTFLSLTGKRGRRPKSINLEERFRELLDKGDEGVGEFVSAVHDTVLEALARGRPVDANTYRSLVRMERAFLEKAGKNLDEDALVHARRLLASRQYMAHGIGNMRPHFLKETKRYRLVRVDTRSVLKLVDADSSIKELGKLGISPDDVAGSPLAAVYVPTDDPSSLVTNALLARAQRGGEVNVYLVDTSLALKEVSSRGLNYREEFWKAIDEGYDGLLIGDLPGGGKMVVSFYDLVPLNTSYAEKLLPKGIKDALSQRGAATRRAAQVTTRVAGHADVEKVIYNEIKRKGGASISIGGEKYVPKQVPPDKAWAVSVYPGRASKPIPLSEFTEEHVRRFIDENLDLLGRHGHYVFGGRLEGDNVYLDISILLPSQTARLDDKAMRELVLDLAARKNQKAIYNMLTDAPVDVDREAPLSIDSLWQKYFDTQEASMDRVYRLFSELLRDDPQRMKLLDEWRDTVMGAYRDHREIIKDALERRAIPPAEAGNRIRKRFSEMLNALSEATNLNFPDAPLYGELLDSSYPLVNEVEDFVKYTQNYLKDHWTDFVEGRLRFTPDEGAEVFRDAAKSLANNWDDIRRKVLGNAMAKTDFVMLNYNNQYGFDYILQAFAPFAFWPTRDALRWAIRTVRAPGAMAGIAQILAQSEEARKHYNIPQRFEYKLPIYLPGASQFLENVPLVGQLAQTGDLGDWFFIDPIRFLVPYRDFLVQFDSPERRNTPMGRVLDYFENFTPLAINPFIKLIGSQVGLLDKDAWSNVYFGGGPFGLPLTPAAQAAAAWLYNGDPLAIPAEEQERFTETGSFSSNFLLKIVGASPDKWDIYRAERAVWTLVARDQLLPGKPHDEQVRAGWEAILNHRGPAWKRAVKAANSAGFFRELTRFTMFPLGDVMAVHEGETMWWGLYQAYRHAVENGELDTFFEKYPEFQMRQAVVRGISDEKEKIREIETELYYQDLERYVNGPFRLQLDLIDTELKKLRNLPQTEIVRQSIDILEAERRAIREQQEERRSLLDIVYPHRNKELSRNRLPRDRALTILRNQYFNIDDEDFDTLTRKQAEFIASLPAQGFTEEDWHEITKEFFLTRLNYGRMIEAAVQQGDFDRVSRLREELHARLDDIHQRALQGVSQNELLAYLAATSRPRTPEELAFEDAQAVFDLWMSLVGDGSLLSGREKAAISNFFRQHPLIQKYYGSSAIDLRNLTPEQKLLLMRRRQIWRQFYALSDTPATQVDYMNMVRDELNAINQALGFPPVTVLDYRLPVPELPTSDPLFERAQMRLALLRRQVLEEQRPDLSPEDLDRIERQLAADPGDLSMLTSRDVDFYVRQYAVPDGFYGGP